MARNYEERLQKFMSDVEAVRTSLDCAMRLLQELRHHESAEFLRKHANQLNAAQKEASRGLGGSAEGEE